ncbi:hypothetical protein [Botrimarina sp.]|uniref:hypothetical protein n=1 Tax=Botrimarina sp. TaxID=2795802 RepID=UPI0032EA92F7
MAGLQAGSTGEVRYGSSGVSLAIVSSATVGDFNLDGLVDAADYTLWRDQQGSVGPGLAADANEDLTVDQADYNIWSLNYGRQLSLTPISSSVPEPSACFLALWVAALAMRPLRRVSA